MSYLKLLESFLHEDLKKYNNQFLIKEDVKSAKAFLEKKGVPLDHPDFLKIKNEWFPNNSNYIFPFVKFRFGDENIRITDLQTVVNAVKRLKLSKPINQYKNFEELVDEINNLESRDLSKGDEKKIKDFIKEIPSTQYNIIKSLSKEEYQNFLDSAKRISTDPKYTNEVKKLLFSQISIFKDLNDKEDLLNFFKNFKIIDKENEFNEVLSDINQDDNAELIYKNENTGVIVARLYSFESAQKLACDTRHCIKNIKSYWETYNPSPLETAQYYIWLTDKPATDPDRKIGVTVKKDGSFKPGATQNAKNENISSKLNDIFNTYNISDQIIFRVPDLKYLKTFIQNTLSDGNLISDDLFIKIIKSYDDNIINNYLSILGSEGKQLPEIQFNVLNGEQKLIYIKNKIEKGFRLPESEFNFVLEKDPNILKPYFLSKIKRKEVLNDLEFVYIINFIPDEIDYIIDYYTNKNIRLTPTQFKYLSAFDKNKANNYITDDILNKGLLNPEEFFFLVKNDKNKAINYIDNKIELMSKNKTFKNLSMIEFGFISQINPDITKKYIDNLLNNKFKKLSKQEFDFIKNNYPKDVLINFVKNKLKSSILKDKILSDEEINLAKQNNLMETKLKNLIKKLILKEKIDYDQIFDTQTLNKIKNLSKETLPNDDIPKAVQDVMSTLPKIKQIESNNKSDLENLAVNFVKSQFPIITKNNIIVDAKLTDNISVSSQEYKQPLKNIELKDKASKRRIINAITQGASTSTHGIHHLVDELNDINPQLIPLYDKIGKGNDVIIGLGDPNMLIKGAIQANKRGMAAGVSEIKQENGKWKIIAKAQTFPVLIHEIVKGLYELISLYGLPSDKNELDDVLGNTDSIESEIDDLKYGKMIYQKIREYILDNHFNIYEEFNEIIEEFLKDIYQLPEDEFLVLITSLINDSPNKRKLDTIINDIYLDLKDDQNI